jgi:hypothetical protein
MSGLQPRGGKLSGDFFIISAQETSIAANTTRYLAPFSNNYEQATESDAQVTADFDFTVRKMRVFVIANTVTADSTVSVRRNGANIIGSQVTIPNATNGEFVANALSQKVALGDTFNFRVAAGATGTDIDVLIYLYCQRVID